ncbi:AbrB family transcriptional regulator [Mesobacillus subterraneus]|uniref:AbrB family transcriptional regulator n=1 Tax=Mesobacillus subterraneus TaxID=285983 RepID=UPI002040E24F|nr:AbrB family transcriptional regulator [Mesobacillus subterraneus]MCM3665004.1 AbrB family transcriptional regulator [Mesobacillus subterraneus]MCM3682091.1 AbrB family transcriptional regulator [Mesobacillus subterraneus]
MSKNSKVTSFLYALLIAVLGGLLFSYFRVPIPWLLGPMSSILIFSRFKRINLYWPPFLRDTALIIVGYSIGLSFTRTAVKNIIANLPSMFFMTVLLVSFAAFMAFIISRLSGVNYPTMLTGSIPGGLSQMIVFAEETKGIDITVVTFMQVSRLLMIVFFVPFVIFGPILNLQHTEYETIGQYQHDAGSYSALLFAAACIIGAFVGKRLRFPTPFLLGPILAAALLTNVGFTGPILPSNVLDASQLLIGGYIGMLLKPEKLQRKTLTIFLALLSGFFLVSGSLAMSFFLSEKLNISIVTSFLSLAPGGMDQMGIIAHEVNADLSMVTGFQLFRLLFVYFAVPPLLRWYFKRKLGSKQESL